jgi:uncharacterized membrane protein
MLGAIFVALLDAIMLAGIGIPLVINFVGSGAILAALLAIIGTCEGSVLKMP